VTRCGRAVRTFTVMESGEWYVGIVCGDGWAGGMCGASRSNGRCGGKPCCPAALSHM
jgi:hypothetical protein